ncbi:MAG: hypothetical protein ABJL99_05130 [Aliishimia sp.]
MRFSILLKAACLSACLSACELAVLPLLPAAALSDRVSNSIAQPILVTDNAGRQLAGPVHSSTQAVAKLETTRRNFVCSGVVANIPNYLGPTATAQAKCSSGRATDVHFSHSVDSGTPRVSFILPQRADRRFRCSGSFRKSGVSAGPFRVYCRSEIQQQYSSGELFWTGEVGPDRGYISTEPGAAVVSAPRNGQSTFKIWLSPDVR